MRVLVTGATGYLGHVVVERLRHADVEVAALVRWMPTLGGADVRRGDLLEAGSLAAAVEDVDAVVHLAALSRGRESVAHPARYYALESSRQRLRGGEINNKIDRCRTRAHGRGLVRCRRDASSLASGTRSIPAVVASRPGP
jgi:NAD dependent epimerase/dehydratase family enzyme